MFLADRLTLDAPVRTKDGFMAVRARAARVGHYQYSGLDVDPANARGLRDQAVVNVLRDENTVFDEGAARSFIGKPITDNHPAEPVTTDNWRQHARGTIMGALRDGDYLAFDLLLTDSAAIAKVDAGKRELSNGYDATLEFGDFTAADGTKCQARQTSIRGNHVALVDRGRAGPDCAIRDAAHCDTAPQSFLDSLKTEKPVKTILIDGLTVDVANVDTALATIATLLAARDAAVAKVAGLETQVATVTTDKATLDAKVVTLEQQLKDAKPSPAQLLDAAKAYQVVVDKAKALGIATADAMDPSAIMKAVVDKRLGDAAKDWNDTQIAASFATLTADVKPGGNIPPIGMPVSVGDAATDYAASREKQKQALRDAWKQPAAANA